MRVSVFMSLLEVLGMEGRTLVERKHPNLEELGKIHYMYQCR